MSSMAKKTFVRTRVPRVERVAGVAVLILLALIAVAVAVKGRYYDPHRYSLDPAALAATRAQAAAAPTVPSGPGPGIVHAAAAPSRASAAAVPAIADSGQLTFAAEGLQPLGPTESYNPDNLYEKIDGQAEAYLNFQFQRLRFRSFSLNGNSKTYVDVYEYDMAKPINAYGIFAMERDPSAPVVDFAAEGYRGAMGFFLRQGKYYVQILASDQQPATLAAAERAARAMAAALPADNGGLEGLKRLPADGNPATLAFTPKDAFGIPGLTNVFQADYPFEGTTLTFFISGQPDAATAAKVFDAFHGFSGQFGKITDQPETAGARLFLVESFGQWRVVYQRGAEVGGVIDAAQRDLALRFVSDFLAGRLRLPAFKPSSATKPAAQPATKPAAQIPPTSGENNDGT
jgi:hypothetical protein